MKRYPALAFRGVADSAEVVLFAAPALEIAEWSGIPQREQFDEDRETIGFQREENQKRLDQLSLYFGNPHNVAQNPLLCAQRSDQSVRFVPDDVDSAGSINPGVIEIEDEDLSNAPLSELFGRLLDELLKRQPSLRDEQPSTARMLQLQDRLHDAIGLSPADHANMTEDDPEAISEEEGVAGLFTSETHVYEFWQEVRLRHDLLLALSDEDRDLLDRTDSFLGFERGALISYLKPVFLVDGQHRLMGAVRAAENAALELMATPEAINRLTEGTAPEDLASELTKGVARLLPVSMLMDTSVQEHVFQFVVVNQKATPVGKALLGTIVATSLTRVELDAVTERLEQVHIDVSDSQAVAWFTRSPDSAFFGLVQQGMENESSGKLRWTVLRDLLAVFRHLRGGRLYHTPRNDYADKWRRQQLLHSALVADVTESEQAAEQLDAAMAHWEALEGPWRDVANSFFLAVRDLLADVSNPAASNGWGSLSNIYNKISLSILVADFFQWLTDTDTTIDSAQECADLVPQWLEGVDKAYFNRDWRLSGVKRESSGIRSQWAELWVDYRKDPNRLPTTAQFRKARSTR